MKAYVAIFCIAVTLSLVFPALAQTTTISIEDIAVTNAGESKTVPIYINDVTDSDGVGTVQLSLLYDPSVVKITGTDDSNTDFAFVTPNYNNTIGVFNVGGTYIGMPPGPSGTVHIIAVTFEAVGSAGDSSSLDITETLLLDATPQQNAIPHEIDDGLFTIEEPTTYNLMISSTAGGSVTSPGEDTFTYNEGTVVDLVATPDADYRFVNWTGDVGTIANANAATTTITMNGDYAILANFEEIPPQYELTVTSTAGGSVTAPGEGTFTYDEGTVVSLKAVAATGYDFESWTGDVGTIANANAATTTITMNGDYAIVANFEEEEEVVRRGGGSYTAADSDGDGFTDVDEILAGTNPNDKNDYPGAKEATPTPAPATPTPAPTAVPTPMPTATPAPTPVPATPTPEEPGFEALLAIGGLLAIAFVILRRKQ